MKRAALFSESEIEREIELLGLNSEAQTRSLAYRLKRIFIRLLRVSGGLIGMWVAYELGAYAFDKPLSALSILMIALMAALALGALVLLVISIGIAFGPKPTHEDRRQQALASLTIKHPVGLSIKTVDYSLDPTGYQVNSK